MGIDRTPTLIVGMEIARKSLIAWIEKKGIMKGSCLYDGASGCTHDEECWDVDILKKALEGVHIVRCGTLYDNDLYYLSAVGEEEYLRGISSIPYEEMMALGPKIEIVKKIGKEMGEGEAVRVMAAIHTW